MNKRGFTLIELLAVIIVLAVIALIITPVIMNIIEDSNKRAAEESINSYISAANNASAISLVDSSKGITVSSDSYIFVTGTNDTTLSKIDISGISPTYVYLEYDINTKEVSIGHFCIKGYSIDYLNGSTSQSDNDNCNIKSNETNNSSSNIFVSVPVNQDIQLTLSDVTGEINWSSSNDNVAKIVAPGIVAGINVGEAEIVATTSSKDYKYNIKVFSSNCNLGSSWSIDYSGDIGSFVVPCTGTYQLEVWGASGGTYTSSYPGGYGGYAIGTTTLDYNKTLYIAVGGAGSCVSKSGSISGGYNGGGGASASRGSGFNNCAGGGATSIMVTNKGTLDKYDAYRDDILIVAGGGGGSSYRTSEGTSYIRGGSGGGYIGGSSSGSSSWPLTVSTGGSQTAGGTGGSLNGDGGYYTGAFGTTSYSTFQSSGGGGGYYGGGTGNDTGGGGGSGYIGNSLLSNKHMTCYNCSTSSSNETYTSTSTNVSSTPISDYSKIGNGYAKITLISY